MATPHPFYSHHRQGFVRVAGGTPPAGRVKQQVAQTSTYLTGKAGVEALRRAIQGHDMDLVAASARGRP